MRDPLRAHTFCFQIYTQSSRKIDAIVSCQHIVSEALGEAKAHIVACLEAARTDMRPNVRIEGGSCFAHGRCRATSDVERCQLMQRCARGARHDPPPPGMRNREGTTWRDDDDRHAIREAEHGRHLARANHYGISTGARLRAHGGELIR